MASATSSKRNLGVEFGVVVLLLLVALSLFLSGVYQPGQTLFSNDGPLGRLMAQCHQLPDRFTGCWEDLNGIGFNGGAASPGVSYGLLFLLKPVWFSKFYALISLIILGLGAWCFFVQMRLVPAACFLGALAAALNSCFFSVACWGVAAQAITAGMFFLALAALADTSSRHYWLRVILAGLAVGMGVMEGADVGAIYSLYVTAFVFYQAWMGEGQWGKKVTLGLSRIALVALCALLIAAPAVFSLVGTYITGVAGSQQDAETKEAHWDWATQWSLPVRETAGLFVPGLFGYRMDTPDGGCYWGEVGQDPAVKRFLENGGQGLLPHGFMRYSGGGFYAGVLVAMVGFWALLQTLLPRNSSLQSSQRRWIWFWLGVAVVSCLLAFGRHAPFYQAIYALPYFSTIRNPVKFVSLVSVALVVFFAFGIDGIWRKYLQPTPSAEPLPQTEMKRGWLQATGFEKKWIYRSLFVWMLGLLAWLMYAADRESMVNYLQSEAVQFDHSMAVAIAGFSFWQVGWFLLFYLVSAVLLASIFNGSFQGTKAKWAGIALGLLLLADLGRANLPWVIYWNYPEKYASNPVVDSLKEQPYEHRVVTLVSQASEQNPNSWEHLFKEDWLQQLYPYYNIQSLDVSDMPRLQEDLTAFGNAFKAPENSSSLQPFIRLWQLANCRYFLAVTNALEALNQSAVPMAEPFRVVQRFDLVPKPGYTNNISVDQLTAAPSATGRYAQIEFTRTLPRAKLYASWQINTNKPAMLEQIASPGFDPEQSVVVGSELPASPSAAGQTADPGRVAIASYAPRDIVLKSDGPAPAVLLFNDQYDPAWKVTVDGQPKPLLRCNYIMRGVYLTAGQHTVEFRFVPPFKWLYLSLIMSGLGLLLLAVVIIKDRVPEMVIEAVPVKPSRRLVSQKAARN